MPISPKMSASILRSVMMRMRRGEGGGGLIEYGRKGRETHGPPRHDIVFDSAKCWPRQQAANKQPLLPKGRKWAASARPRWQRKKTAVRAADCSRGSLRWASGSVWTTPWSHPAASTGHWSQFIGSDPQRDASRSTRHLHSALTTSAGAVSSPS